MKLATSLFLAILIAALIGCGATVSSSSTATATVLEVYTTTDAIGHTFVAYVVDHNGTEVVVSDGLADSSHKVGDSIRYMEIKMQVAGGTYKVISYSISR